MKKNILTGLINNKKAKVKTLGIRNARRLICSFLKIPTKNPNINALNNVQMRIGKNDTVRYIEVAFQSPCSWSNA